MHIVLVNGWSAPKSLWEGFFDSVDFCSRFDVLDINQELDIESWMEQIDRLVSPGALLLGWSLGGMLALKYASQTSKSLSGVVTMMALPSFVNRVGDHGFGMSLDSFTQFKSRFENNGKGDAVGAFHFLMAEGEPSVRKAIAQIRRIYQRAEIDGYVFEEGVLIQSLSLLSELNLSDCLKSIEVDSLVILSAKDALVPLPDLSLLKDCFTTEFQPTVLVFEEGGHCPFLSQKEGVLYELRDFVLSLNRVQV